MEPSLSFWVNGLPAPQGSKSPKRNQYTGRIHMIESSKKVLPWRQNVELAARFELETEGADYGHLWDGALSARMVFYFVRPKKHFGTGRNAQVLKESAPDYPVNSPDVDKLVRSTFDGMTGAVFADDKQVIFEKGIKLYGPRSGARITVWLAPAGGWVDPVQ